MKRVVILTRSELRLEFTCRKGTSIGLGRDEEPTDGVERNKAASECGRTSS